MFYYFAGAEERDLFIANPDKFTKNILFSSERAIPNRYRHHKCAELVAQEKAILGHCPVTLKDQDRVEKGNPILIVGFKDMRFVFANEEKLCKFFADPTRYASVALPVKMPPQLDPVSLHYLQKQEDSITFMEQALGSIVTRGLREVGENRLKYPTLTCKETMLKLFAIFLKAQNPANTEYMKEKYTEKMMTFIERCEVPQELFELAEEKKKTLKKGKNWPQFKENYYNQLGAKYDEILKIVKKEKADGFSFYIK